jgi:TetR/AcrR family transcriptional regulator, cholesterol catabolism regulator
LPATRKVRTRSGAKPVSVEQIESEAVLLFSEKTYPAVGMRDISDAVGLLPGSLYVHIKSKEEVLLKIVQGGIALYLDGMTPIVESDEPAAVRLRRLMLKYMEILDGNLERTTVAVFQWRYLSEPGRTEVIAMRDRYQQLFARVIDEGIASGEFSTFRHRSVVVAGVIGLLNSTMHWYSPSGSVPAAEIGEQLAELVLRALAT